MTTVTVGRPCGRQQRDCPLSINGDGKWNEPKMDTLVGWMAVGWFRNSLIQDLWAG